MKTGAKVVVGGCVVLIAIVVAATVGMYFYARNSGVFERAPQIRAEGEREGKSKSESQCVDLALQRRPGDPVDAALTSQWLSGCLHESRLFDNFCDGVPPQDEFRRSISWSKEVCRARGAAAQPGCPSLMQEVQRYCHGGWRGTKVARGRTEQSTATR